MPMARGQGVAPLGAAEVVEEGLRRQAERDRLQRQAATPGVDAAPSVATAHARLPVLPEESPCFVIDEIGLEGRDAVRFHWLVASTDSLLGRCIGPIGVALITRYLDAQLIEQGYVTSRVSVPAQSMAGGRLSIMLHAGRLGRISMIDTDSKLPDERWGTPLNAFPTGSGRLLNVRDLEQGVEQMKRLPTQSVTTTLTPDVAADTSQLVIERRTADWVQRLRGGLGVDNSGSPTLGRTQYSANLAFDNALGVNDIASVGLNGSAEHPSTSHRSQSGAFNYSVPAGYGLLSAAATRSRFGQRVQLTTTTVLSSGESNVASLRYDHVAWRTAGSKTGLYGELATRKARSFIDDLELTESRRRTTFIEVGASYRQVAANNASAEVALGYRRGVPWLSAQDDLPVEAGGITLRPRISTLQAAASLPFSVSGREGTASRPWTLSTLLRAQRTGNITTSIDQMAIGGRGSVRGFNGDSVLLAESGWTLRNELSTALELPSGAEGTVYLGIDFGRVWGPSDRDLLGHYLAGGVIGTRTRWQALQLELALATPLAKPDGFNTPGLTAYLSATCTF